MRSEINNSIVNDKLLFIRKALEIGSNDVVVKESCVIFELLFKKVISQALSILPFEDREQILQKEREVGKGTKGYQHFTFGEIIGLFRECNLLTKWSEYSNKDLGLLKSIDLNAIVKLRNNLVHEASNCTSFEARLIVEYLFNWLAVLGYNDLNQSISSAFSRDTGSLCEGCTASEKSQESKNKKDGKREKSIYQPTYENEKEWLRIQANNALRVDSKAFQYVMSNLENKNNLLAIDVGCAEGYVTYSRFSKYKEQFKGIIGLDINTVKIEEANKSINDPIFSFYELDIEDNSMEESLKNVLEQNNVQGFDLVFSALTIHHLQNPIKMLSRLRRMMNKGAFIMLRGSDDGSKLAYPDEENLISEILKLTLKAKGVSDRLNGRKIFNQLWRAGFRNIKMLYDIKDTVGMDFDERHDLFIESFNYRKDYYKKLMNAEPENEQHKQDH